MTVQPIFYAIQVKTRGEPKYLKFAEKILNPLDVRIFWPRRSLRLRRRGKWQDILSPIFPGYLFIEAETISAEIYWQLKRLPGFFRFLKSNQDIRPMPEKDARILFNLMKFGEIVRKSIVDFDEGGRIRIIEGPLIGLEGRIVKVDRRKERAKIKLDLYEESYLIDFGFKYLEKNKNPESDT